LRNGLTGAVAVEKNATKQFFINLEYWYTIMLVVHNTVIKITSELCHEGNRLFSVKKNATKQENRVPPNTHNYISLSVKEHISASMICTRTLQQ